MVLQGQILSKEEKGYIIEFGFKDQTKGFLKAGFFRNISQR